MHQMQLNDWTISTMMFLDCGVYNLRIVARHCLTDTLRPCADHHRIYILVNTYNVRRTCSFYVSIPPTWIALQSVDIFDETSLGVSLVRIYCYIFPSGLLLERPKLGICLYSFRSIDFTDWADNKLQSCRQHGLVPFFKIRVLEKTLAVTLPTTCIADKSVCPDVQLANANGTDWLAHIWLVCC